MANIILLPKTESPLAIAMWDFSWLQMHYPGGPFEDWDACLAGLVVRGYNAIRIDCFPQHIAKTPDGSKYGFAFNCTSNFTHPQFPGVWNDIAWHKKMTLKIKSAANF